MSKALTWRSNCLIIKGRGNLKNIKTVLIIVFIVLLIGSIFFYFIKRAKDNNLATTGADSNSIISSQADWSQGIMSNITISETGYIEIDEITDTKLDLSNTDNITCNYQSENEQYLGDGEIDTGYWGGSGENRLQDGWYCDFDLGEIRRITSARVNFETTDKFSLYGFVIHKSINGSVWGVVEDSTLHFLEPPNPPTWYDYPMINPYEDARYIRIIPIESGPPTISGYLREFELYAPGAIATHITAPTQIDGQEGDENKTLIEWTSFEATDNTPENTSITYEFRVSDDAENWTDWTSDFLSVESRRYLQIKATLKTTDLLAVPKIDDYTINFHNNLPPNAPTAETVIIGK